LFKQQQAEQRVRRARERRKEGSSDIIWRVVCLLLSAMLWWQFYLFVIWIKRTSSSFCNDEDKQDEEKKAKTELNTSRANNMKPDTFSQRSRLSTGEIRWFNFRISVCPSPFNRIRQKTEPRGIAFDVCPLQEEVPIEEHFFSSWLILGTIISQWDEKCQTREDQKLLHFIPWEEIADPDDDGFRGSKNCSTQCHECAHQAVTISIDLNATQCSTIWHREKSFASLLPRVKSSLCTKWPSSWLSMRARRELWYRNDSPIADSACR
jgi:hypothetical protein